MLHDQVEAAGSGLAPNPKTSQFVALMATPETILRAVQGTSSELALDKEKSESMLQLLRPRPVSQLTSILGVPEDLFEGDDEEAAAALGGDEQNNAVTASETLMPLLQASTRAAALLAQEQGQLGSLRFVRRLRMEYGSDGTPIQYDGEDKQALELHGLNIVHGKQIVALLTHLGLKPAFGTGTAWVEGDNQNLRIYSDETTTYSAEPKVRVKVFIRLDHAAKQFLDHAYVLQQPLWDSSLDARPPPVVLPTTVRAAICLGRDDNYHYKWALETESAEGASALREAMELLLLCGVSEQQILDMIVWHLHKRHGMVHVAEVVVEHARPLLAAFDPDRVEKGRRARHGRLLVRMAGRGGYKEIQETMTRNHVDHTVIEIDHRAYFCARAGPGALEQAKLLQLPAIFPLVLRDINKITQREKTTQACIALRVHPPSGLTLAQLLEGMVMKAVKGNRAAVEHGTSSTATGAQNCIAATTQAFLDHHVYCLNDGGMLTPGRSPKITVEITPCGGQDVGSSSLVLILFEESAAGAEGQLRDRNDDVVLIALQLAVLIANRSSAAPYKHWKWCPIMGAGATNPVCTLDRVTVSPGFGGGSLEARPWINVCADNTNGERGTLPWRAMKGNLVSALLAVMQNSEDKPAAEGLINLALCAGGPQKRTKEALSAMKLLNGDKPRLIIGLPKAAPAQEHLDEWSARFNSQPPTFLQILSRPLYPYMQLMSPHLRQAIQQRALGQPTSVPFEGLEEIARRTGWSIPAGDGLQPICCECQEAYTIGTGLECSSSDLGGIHAEFADVTQLKEQLGSARLNFIADMKDGALKCNHCIRCVDKAITCRLDQICMSITVTQAEDPAGYDALAPSVGWTILAPLSTLRRWPDGGGKQRMTLSPPSLEDGRGKDDRKRDDDRHEKKRPNQDRDMDSTEVKGQSSHPQPEGGTRTTSTSGGETRSGAGIRPTQKAGHPSSPATLPPMKADDDGPRTDLGALDSAPDPPEDIGQRRGDDDNMGAGKMKIDDGRPCGRAGALAGSESFAESAGSEICGQREAAAKRWRGAKASRSQRGAKSAVSASRNLRSALRNLRSARSSGEVLDAAPSQSGDNGPGQGQCDTTRAEEMTCPCPTRDGRPYVRTMVRDEVLQYLGLSADTARPPGLPKSPPPCKGRRQR